MPVQYKTTEKQTQNVDNNIRKTNQLIIMK